MTKDYYAVMGLSRNTSEKEIKMAYRRLARKYHPDLNKEDKSAEEKFKELGEAYEVLKDPEKRKLYDTYGSADVNQQGGAQPHQEYAHYYSGSFGDFDDDILSSIFNRGSFHQKRQHKGADIQGTINISLEEAYSGVTKEVQIPVQGAVSGHQKLRIKIPKGIKSGQKIRLEGKGSPDVLGSGKSGDLYIIVNVDKHALFDVLGNDIYLTVPVTPWEVALGAKIEVPTLGGKVGLTIPPKSQGGQTLRLKGRGLSGTIAGDQYVLLKIVIPEPKTEEEKELYESMAKSMPFNPREKMEHLYG